MWTRIHGQNKRSTLLKAYAPPGAKEALKNRCNRVLYPLPKSNSFVGISSSTVVRMYGVVYPIRQAFAISIMDLAVLSPLGFIAGDSPILSPYRRVDSTSCNSVRYRQACEDRSLSWRQLCRLIRLHGQKKRVEIAVCFAVKRKYGLT